MDVYSHQLFVAAGCARKLLHCVCLEHNSFSHDGRFSRIDHHLNGTGLLDGETEARVIRAS